MTNGNQHKIVIVGGGVAGLEPATSLGQKSAKKGLAEVTLFDAAFTHIWKPLLHEVATKTLDQQELLEDFEDLATLAGHKYESTIPLEDVLKKT
jgi:NADH dehydrogenase